MKREKLTRLTNSHKIRLRFENKKQIPLVLKNQLLELYVDHPLEGYRLPRFDWTGKIYDLKFRGLSLVGAEKEVVEAGDCPGLGFYNEFGIDKPVGYEDIQPGEWFHKIGIGLLQKTAGDYFFAHPYRIQPLEFSVKAAQEQLMISCKGPLTNGYAYTLAKTIQLTGHGFAIHYQLTNTGEKPIETDEYNHNFIRLGKEAVGEGCQLEFSSDVQPGSMGEVVNPDGIVQFQEKRLHLTDTPQSPFFYSFLNGKNAVPAQWKLINKKRGIGIQETGSFTTPKVNLWGWKGAISPELFHSIRLSPGHTENWKRSYTIFSL